MNQGQLVALDNRASLSVIWITELEYYGYKLHIVDVNSVSAASICFISSREGTDVNIITGDVMNI